MPLSVTQEEFQVLIRELTPLIHAGLLWRYPKNPKNDSSYLKLLTWSTWTTVEQQWAVPSRMSETPPRPMSLPHWRSVNPTPTSWFEHTSNLTILPFLNSTTAGDLNHFHHLMMKRSKAAGLSLVALFWIRKNLVVIALLGRFTAATGTTGSHSPSYSCGPPCSCVAQLNAVWCIIYISACQLITVNSASPHLLSFDALPWVT